MSADWKTIVEKAFGEKCADFDPDCAACQVWAGIADLEAQLATALEQANGWKAEAMTQNVAIHGTINAARARGDAPARWRLVSLAAIRLLNMSKQRAPMLALVKNMTICAPRPNPKYSRKGIPHVQI